MRPLSLVVVALSAAVAVSGCGSSGNKAGGREPPSPRVLTLAEGATDPSELQNFVEEVAKLSQGRLRIEVHSSWRRGQVDFENGVVKDVRAGKADLGWVGSRAWDSFGIQSFWALTAPFLIDSYPLEERVLRSRLVEPMLRSLDRIGVVALGILPGSMRKPLGVRRPLVRPADFAGLTIAVQQSRVADETMRALGARSIWIPIQRIDIRRFGGIEQRLSTIVGWEYDSVGRYLTGNVDFWPRPLVFFANRATFESLGDLERGALRQAAAEVISAQIAWDRASDREASDDICRAGFVAFETANSADHAALRKAVQPVYERLERDSFTRTAIAAIARLKRTVGAPPDLPPPCPRSTRALGAASSPIDGVWRVTTKYGDFPGDPSPSPENYGQWTYVLDRGRFAFTQRYRDACTWGYGTFRMNGHETAWTFKDGGGIAPNNAVNKPGEFFRFGWSRYRDTLQFTPVKGAISPENFRLKPWHLLSATPSRRYLDKRCLPPAAALPRAS